MQLYSLWSVFVHMFNFCVAVYSVCYFGFPWVLYVRVCGLWLLRMDYRLHIMFAIPGVGIRTNGVELIVVHSIVHVHDEDHNAEYILTRHYTQNHVYWRDLMHHCIQPMNHSCRPLNHMTRCFHQQHIHSWYILNVSALEKQSSNSLKILEWLDCLANTYYQYPLHKFHSPLLIQTTFRIHH